MECFYPFSLHVTQCGRLGYLSCSFSSKNCLCKVKLSGCSRNSCTVINILKCFQDTSAFPSVSSLDTVLGLSINAHVVHSPSCPYRRLFGCHWGREQALGRAWGECTCTRAGDETRGGVSLTHRLFLGLMPAILLRESWRPSRMSFLVPRPKTKLNILKHHRLRRCHGIWGKVGVFNRWFHHHSSWTKNRAHMLRRTHKVAEQNTGWISQGSDHFPGQAWAEPVSASFLPYNSWFSFREFQVNNR